MVSRLKFSFWLRPLHGLIIINRLTLLTRRASDHRLKRFYPGLSTASRAASYKVDARNPQMFAGRAVKIGLRWATYLLHTCHSARGSACFRQHATATLESAPDFYDCGNAVRNRTHRY